MYHNTLRTMAAFIVGTAVITLAASSLNAQVLSQNAVGYVKITLYDVDPILFDMGGVEVLLSDLILTTADDLIQSSIGPDELNTVSASLTGQYSSGSVVAPLQLDGVVQLVARNKAASTTGTFQTEIVAMSLSGNVPGPVPLDLRESPTLSSLGSVAVTDIGGGLYHIDSFFDVFTELSVDGGNSWSNAANAPSRAIIFPEPGALTLMALGGLAVLRRR